MMYSKKKQKQIKRMIKKAKKEADQRKTKTKGEDSSWLQKIVRYFL